MKKILLSPLQRFWRNRCCPDKDHISNCEEEDYEENLFKGLDVLRRSCKDFLFMRGVVEVKVANTAQLLCGAEPGRTTTSDHIAELASKWGPDPVHPDMQCFFYSG